MINRYLGHLPPGDPLDGYLRFDIAPQPKVRGKPAGFRVFQFVFPRDVTLYEEIGEALPYTLEKKPTRNNRPSHLGLWQ